MLSDRRSAIRDVGYAQDPEQRLESLQRGAVWLERGYEAMIAAHSGERRPSWTVANGGWLPTSSLYGDLARSCACTTAQSTNSRE